MIGNRGGYNSPHGWWIREQPWVDAWMGRSPADKYRNVLYALLFDDRDEYLTAYAWTRLP